MDPVTDKAQTVPRVNPGSGAAAALITKARSETLPVWVLLPLRAFMGFTFVFAGLQKLSDRAFFTDGAPGSIYQQLQASNVTSPVRFLVSPALHAPVFFGIVIALAELAVGLGVALGLFGRIAAGGGMLLSLLFFLTVSYNTWPYYYGSDIVFFFAWTPLLLAGSGPLSLDAALDQAVRRRSARPVNGSQQATPGERDVGRRIFVRRLGVAGAVAAVGCFVAGATAAIGRAAAGTQDASPSGGDTPVLGGGTGTTTPTTGGSTPTTGGSTPTTGSSPAGSGTKIGLASSVPVGGAASFTDPSNGQPAYVVQPQAGDFVAFSRICTHAGCTVNFFQGSPPEFRCPCHGSIYNATTGQVIQGPATLGLPSIRVSESSGGELLAED